MQPGCLLLLFFSASVFAQGHGSYGGIANDIFKLILVVIAVIGLLILLVIRSIFGDKVARNVLLMAGIGFASLVIYGQLEEHKRLNAYKDIEYSFAVGCAKTSRSMDIAAKGDEHILIRLHNESSVPEFHESELLPIKNQMANDVEIVTDVPKDVNNAIAIDIKYSRDLMPGSYPGYEWKRTRYELTARLLPQDKIIAQTVDMEARNGFCLGDLEEFLQRALNRPGGVLRKHESHGSSWPPFRLPDAYVRGQYAEGTQGVYLKTIITPPSEPFNNLDAIEKMLSSKGCKINKPDISPHFASCGDAERKSEVFLRGLLAMHELPNSLLFIYEWYKGIDSLTTVRVEERETSLELRRVWVANLMPPSKQLANGSYINEINVSNNVLSGAVYAQQKFDFNSAKHAVWFERRYDFKIPLPNSIN